MKIGWEELLMGIAQCNRCALRAGCTQTVPGEGNRNAALMCIGEGPGAQEDEQGRPFVGAAGQLLNKILGAIDVRREDVYIANIVKCRPPHNRAPSPQEAEACLPYLRAQVLLVKPRIIVALGATAGQYVISPSLRVTRDHGQWSEKTGYWMLATYHPSALLRDESKKADAWEDWKMVKAKLMEVTDGTKQG